MTQDSDKALEEKARTCAESIYYDEDTKTVKASAEWLTYVASEIASVLREVAEEAKREEAAAWEFIIGIVCTAADRAEILRRRARKVLTLKG